MILCSKLIGRKIELDEFKELSGMKSPDRMTQRLIALMRTIYWTYSNTRMFLPSLEDGMSIYDLTQNDPC